MAEFTLQDKMTKITSQKVLEKIQNLDKYLGYLDCLREEAKSEESFIKDFHLFGLAERYLQLSIQVIIDIFNLIIIEEELEKPEEREEIISLLFNYGVISENLASRLDGIVGFRNILVHEYGKIDRKRVYRYLIKRLNDFFDLKKEVLKWLKEKNL